jgi:hypothetical protein
MTEKKSTCSCCDNKGCGCGQVKRPEGECCCGPTCQCGPGCNCPEACGCAAAQKK